MDSAQEWFDKLDKNPKKREEMKRIAKELSEAIAISNMRERKEAIKNKRLFEKIKVNPFKTIINGLDKYKYVDDDDGWIYEPKTRQICAYCLALYSQHLIHYDYEPANEFSQEYQQWKFVTYGGKIRYVRACTMVGQGTINVFEVVDKLPYSKVLNINTMEVEERGYSLGMDYVKLLKESKSIE